MDILTLAVAKNSASSTPGQKGDTGNGIKSTVMNDDYTLTIEFTDGTSYTTPSIRGEKGETGSKVHKEFRVFRVFKVKKVIRVTLVLLVKMVLMVQMVLMENQ